MVVDSDMILCEQGMRLWAVVLCVRGCKEHMGIANIGFRKILYSSSGVLCMG